MKKLLTVILSISMLFAFSVISGCSSNPQMSAPEGGKNIETADTDSYPIELTENQMFDFQNRLSTLDNYGFLFSAYSNICDVDLNQVLYVGAGMSNPENSDEISDAYLGLIGETELFSDCTILTTQQIDEFLSAKTGKILCDMNGSFTWKYVSEYDAYVCMHGDTNYLPLSVVGGRQVNKNVFEVEYCFDGGFYDEDGNLMKGGTVTVSTDGPSMIFVSNSLHG